MGGALRFHLLFHHSDTFYTHNVCLRSVLSFLALLHFWELEIKLDNFNCSYRVSGGIYNRCFSKSERGCKHTHECTGLSLLSLPCLLSYVKLSWSHCKPICWLWIKHYLGDLHGNLLLFSHTSNGYYCHEHQGQVDWLWFYRSYLQWRPWDSSRGDKRRNSCFSYLKLIPLVSPADDICKYVSFNAHD